MNGHEESHDIQETIKGFASTLNSADAKSIPSHFSNDAKFMPDGSGTITGAGLLKKSGEKHLSATEFKIKFSDFDINIDNNYAFVNARAETSQLDPVNNQKVVKSSRDFFVLRKTDQSWKIYRYIFNNVKII
ncbi:YybH family protein [Pedobacter sp. AW31-3R]|uniref:YybH family protein n=1 Tax=Pedobacter sp. AW31-3R TaxID=3445781 RepID=UPI003F9FBAAF